MKEEYIKNKPYGNNKARSSTDDNAIILYHYYNRVEQDYQIFM